MEQIPTQEGSSGEALFLEQLPLIERVIAFVARRHRLTADAAEEFGSAIKIKLIENNYAVLRGFQGRSSLQTYLTVVIQRAFLDQRAAAWGKWRPSAEAKRLGAMAIELERLHHRDGLTFDEACETLCTKHGDGLSRKTLEEIGAKLPPRTTRRLEGEEQLADVPVVAEAASLGERDARRALAQRVERVIGHVMGSLAPQDRLVLRLRFADGFSVADIARSLRLEQKALYRRIEKMVDELRLRLQEAGLKQDEVRDALAQPGFDISLTAWSPERGMASPSMTKGASR